MSEHTKGRLTFDGKYIYAREDESPLFRIHPTRDEAAQQANARRLVACWNACQGYTTEYLEEGDPFTRKEQLRREEYDELSAERDRLKALLHECCDLINNAWPDYPSAVMKYPQQLVKRVNAALSRATETKG